MDGMGLEMGDLQTVKSSAHQKELGSWDFFPFIFMLPDGAKVVGGNKFFIPDPTIVFVFKITYCRIHVWVFFWYSIYMLTFCNGKT